MGDEKREPRQSNVTGDGRGEHRDKATSATHAGVEHLEEAARKAEADLRDDLELGITTQSAVA